MDIEVKAKVLVAQLCQLFVTPWTVAHQASLSVGFPWEEYWDGNPEWVAIPFSRRSSQLRNWTWVSCTAGGFFTS